MKKIYEIQEPDNLEEALLAAMKGCCEEHQKQIDEACPLDSSYSMNSRELEQDMARGMRRSRK